MFISQLSLECLWMQEKRNDIFDLLKAVPPFWNFCLSIHMGTKTIIIYYGFDIHVNLYWFLNYHPEDFLQDSQKIEDEPSELSCLFVKPRGFNDIFRQILFKPRMDIDVEHIRFTERIAFDNKRSNFYGFP